MASSDITSDITSGTTRYHSLSSDSGTNIDYIANNIVPMSLRFMFESDDQMDSESYGPDVSCEKLNIDPFVTGHIVDHQDVHGEFISRLKVKGLSREEFDPTVVVIRVSGVSADMEKIRDSVIDLLEKYSKDHTLTRFSEKVVHKEVIGLIETKAAYYLMRNGFHATSVFQQEDQGQISAIGPKKEVDKLAEELLRDIVTQRKDIREKVFSADQLLLLQLRQFDKKMMKKNPEFVIEIQTDKVRVEGLQEDVNSIFLEIEKMLINFDICRIELSEIQFRLFEHRNVTNRILKQLSDQHRLKKVQLHVDSNTLVIAAERQNINKVKKAVLHCLKQDILVVPEIAVSLEELLKTIQQLPRIMRKDFEVELDKFKREIKFACLEKDFKNVQHKVQEQIEQQTLREKTIALSEAQLLFLDLKFTEDVVGSANLTFLPNNAGIVIRGLSNDIELCRNKIMSKVKNVKTTRFGIKAEKKVLDFLSSADGKKVMKEVAGKHSVGTIGPNRRNSLKIEMGRIENYKADVLLNSVSTDLDLGVGAEKIASSFLMKGGKELQSLLNTKYPEGVAYNELAVTMAMKDLPSKHIFHCCLERFVSDSVSIPKLKRMLEKCLEESETLGHESLAMPVLCAGVNDFPPNLIVTTIFDVLEDYFQKNPFAKLQTITVVVQPSKQQLKERFDNEMEKRNRNISFIGQYFIKTALYLSDMDIDVVSDVDDVTDFITSLGMAISDIVT